MTLLKALLMSLATLIVGLVMGTALGFYVSRSHYEAKESQKAAQVTEVSHKADNKAMSQRASDAKAQAIDKEKADAATAKALEAHKDWADQPVPDDVLDAISM